MEEKENFWILRFQKQSVWNDKYFNSENGRMGGWEERLVAQDGFRFFVPDKNGLIPDEEGEYECDNNIHDKPIFISRGAGYYTIYIVRKYKNVKHQLVINRVEMLREEFSETYKITITETTDGKEKTIYIHTSSHEKRKGIIEALKKKGRKIALEGSKIKILNHAHFDSIKMICAEVL